MALPYHFTVDPPYSFTTDSKEATRTKLNDNSTIFEHNSQEIEDRLEDTLDDLFDACILSGMVGTINAGTLTFAVTVGVALIGVRVACSAGNVTLLANQTSQPIYFCQDSTWTTTLPTTKSYLVWGTYTSDGTEITVLTRTASGPSLAASSKISIAGTVKTDNTFLTLSNSGNASDMDGTGTSILFNQYYYDASTPAEVDAAKIMVATETDWTSVAGTQDAYMSLQVVLDGTMTEKMRLTSTDTNVLGYKTNFSSGATNPTTSTYGITLGGASAGTPDTNMYRSAANEITTDDAFSAALGYKIPSDTYKYLSGAGSDMSMYYNGTDGYIETDLVAASDFHIKTGADKTLVLDTVVWEDLRITAGSFDRPGISDPAIIAYNVNGGGINTYLWEFQVDDIASFVAQLPHSYKQGEDITVHIHWTPGPRGNEENGAKVGWKIDYSWANIDGTFGTMSTADLSDACDGTDHKHQMTPSVTLTGSGKNISSMLLCNVKRTDTGTDDTWAGTATGELPLLLEIDFHYPLETLGSRQAGVK